MTDPANRWLQTRTVAGAAYDSTYEQRAAAGENVHGEADFVQRFAPGSVLDAGCGTGRVGRELASRGIDVVGVDIDERMLATAREKGAGTEWLLGDLTTIDLGRQFDAIVMAGNVMIFLAPRSEGAVVANMARHLSPGGHLIAGFQLAQGRLPANRYDALAAEAGLVLAERWSTWHSEPSSDSDTYAVSVHLKLSPTTS